MIILNQIWDFFASVKLAITTLCAIAITSIIGTVIQQGETQAFYVKQYGAKTAQFFKILDIPEMYYSWWFLGLLGLLATNLIICSIERFPSVWKVIHSDNLSVSGDRLQKMQNQQSWEKLGDTVTKQLPEILRSGGWKYQEKQNGKQTLFFSDKGKYSRTGVYLVHLSILVIFVGAIIGHFYGFKGSVMIPEGQSTEKAYAYGDSKALQLGFEIRCNNFEIEFYDNGMPKEYTSDLTVYEQGKEVLSKSIEVNKPLDYKGFTFYQSSYQGYQDFIIKIADKSSGESKVFTAPFQKQQAWQEMNVQFGVINAEAIGQRVVRAKVWFKIPNETAFTGWVDDNNDLVITIGEKEYLLHVKQMYSTGLQVAKDPGVWVVYIGCGLMLLGLYMAFFMSHQRLWLLIESSSNNNRVLLSGSANKNRLNFKQRFSQLVNQFEDHIKSQE